MVRVISVHHFTNQNVHTVEQPTACTVAPPDRLLLALTNNCVEVRDLQKESEVLFTFPTVDEVVQILHCLNGDYVSTLETKFNRQNREINFVRVYVNWGSIATLQQSKMTSSGVSLGSSECGMVQPMRARIAGRVTPTTNQSELGSLEMIEIPVKRNPNAIACCQVSGNLIILSRHTVNLYRFHIRTHDISKLRFVDFEELPFLIELGFSPFEICICENYVAVVAKDAMHMFKIVASTVAESYCENSVDSNINFLLSNYKPIDYRQLVRDEAMNVKKEKITVNLPTIVKENSLIHKHSPFTFSDKDLVAVLKATSPTEVKVPNYKLVDLIQLRLVPIVVENAQRQVAEEFKSIILRPMYIEQNFNKNVNEWDNAILKSDYRKCLNGVACMIATQQEGYLHFFGDADKDPDEDHCIAVYPFTSPVYKLVMEDHLLHALTETGLESYTLRVGHQLCRNFDVIDNLNNACPEVNECICLVGLRPFLGVERILLSENYIVLLANSDGSPAHSMSSSGSSTASFLTLYNLELPSPKTIFNDICIVANVHRFTSTQTYCHLLSEAHMILRVALLTKKWTVTDDNVRLIIQRSDVSDDLVETYRTSCALLGDHYIMCSDEANYALAIPYYKIARVAPLEALKRVKKIEEQSNQKASKGLMWYLKHILREVKTSLDADRYFRSTSKNSFAEIMLDLLESHGYEDLPYLILKSKMLREYSTDKLAQILSDKCAEEEDRAERHLALTILQIQKGNGDVAETCLRKISRERLVELLLDNWDLLFETTYVPQSKTKGVTSFSELSVLLISVCPELLADILVRLIVEKKTVNLCKIIKVFIEYLPSSIGNDSNYASLVLQKMLESYFSQYFARPENVDLTKVAYERGASEAMKLLVRSYLSQLQILQLRDERRDSDDGSAREVIENECAENDSDETGKDGDQEKLRYNHVYKTYFDEKAKKPKGNFLFSEFRYEYLDKMPPFQVEITSKIYQLCVENYTAAPDCQPNDEADTVLKKLQALLCSQVVPKQVGVEISGFLAVNSNLRGNLSLQSIISGTNDAVTLLLDACPQCLLQFAKDRFTKTDEWKFLIAAVQTRILQISQQEHLKRICFFHKKLLKDILTCAASTFPVDQLQQVFPQQFSVSDTDSQNVRRGNVDAETNGHLDRDDDFDLVNEIHNYEPYIAMCKDAMHANNINKVLKSKAQQLLCTLNL
ncbi:uncharacterized protein LOC132706255 isoform X2 [Cylas formicarius]|uniref:uncharacterized protein LOC132706255 isoform X2 n=1 Tax=Cylas formicarius TaxID=197179 RepID=UPI002958B831|nr:uncharacterized protein LOC132706255 isoform X2 [Cylas formicarius]